jgi:hypothetical protein
MLKGLKLGGTVNVSWRRGDYYFYPDGYSPVAARELFSRPTLATFNAIVGYERKFERFGWSTQINVSNLLDDYEVLVRPNNITGFSGITNAVYTTQPRTWAWTNTFKF